MSPERVMGILLAFVLLANAVQGFIFRRLKHIKIAADALREESAKIHVLVNSRLTLALRQNEALIKQNEALIRRIAVLTGKGE